MASGALDSTAHTPQGIKRRTRATSGTGHDATTSTWVKAAITYVVPFCVSNLGILTATRSQA